jgi:hypothetical protein
MEHFIRAQKIIPAIFLVAVIKAYTAEVAIAVLSLTVLPLGVGPKKKA